ncbi:uncharacterized protein PHALS_09013 [Plasmopara halstedii]|uniref:Uncharacterized protein n=1 Tax=Plasmopara halstedii TaxID=4781 RepID=A0A0N7L4L0_PLAHL|nr:uncharacterized protein PHALS_09013 [Plasmopara halstedii]CEG38971.1 hypothetical protein PHALS_09013 [Plasmopara halstedii]|eukprot:XP_024575340.1 hypothetical protein PHALS_09013 [Plasmopara halstedii]
MEMMDIDDEEEVESDSKGMEVNASAAHISSSVSRHNKMLATEITFRIRLVLNRIAAIVKHRHCSQDGC